MHGQKLFAFLLCRCTATDDDLAGLGSEKSISRAAENEKLCLSCVPSHQDGDASRPAAGKSIWTLGCTQWQGIQTTVKTNLSKPQATATNNTTPGHRATGPLMDGRDCETLTDRETLCMQPTIRLICSKCRSNYSLLLLFLHHHQAAAFRKRKPSSFFCSLNYGYQTDAPPYLELESVVLVTNSVRGL